MGREFKVTIDYMRHWAGRVVDDPNDELLSERCLHIAEGLRALLQDDLWQEGKVFYRVLLVECHLENPKFFLHMAEEDLHKRGENLQVVFSVVGKGYSKKLREDVADICERISSICNRALVTPLARNETESPLLTYLKKPRFRLIKGGKYSTPLLR